MILRLTAEIDLPPLVTTDMSMGRENALKKAMTDWILDAIHSEPSWAEYLVNNCDRMTLEAME